MINLQTSLIRFFFVLAISLGISVQAHAVVTSLKKGDTITLPAFTLLDGSEIASESLKNKPVLLSFWASWCPYCARQNPYIQKLHEQVKGSNMQVVTVSIDKDLKAASDYMAKHNYTFAAAKFTPQLKAVFGEIKIIPLVYVVDKNSIIQEVIPGEMFEEDVLDMRKYAK
jgi:thiol-disulfide isomerase/thioredoxin